MSAMAFQNTSLTIVYLTVIQAQINENVKAPRSWPFWEEFTGDRWIRRTKDQCEILKSCTKPSKCHMHNLKVNVIGDSP